MFDLHSEMCQFQKDHVKLSKDERDQLKEYRNTNVSRLKKGLKSLGFKNPKRTPTQGGYAMHTLAQRPENNPDVDHDIDVATIFRKEDLPENPLAARQRIRDAIIEGGGNFKKDPEARTNAVTVWYKENYHVDMPVHREYEDVLGVVHIEHAGVEWKPRDPMEITNWFNDEVNDQSPKQEFGAKVDDYQMRRVIKFLKYFSKSRLSWELAGGLIISTLVAECYCSSDIRDDHSLYDTMVAVRDRLEVNLSVLNPVDSTQELTYKQEYKNQVRRFKEKLASAIEWLAPLQDADCTRLEALKGWNKVFKHSYWKSLIEQEEKAIANARGQEISEARSAGQLFATANGLLTSRPQEKQKHIQVPNHRFYGGDL